MISAPNPRIDLGLRPTRAALVTAAGAVSAAGLVAAGGLDDDGPILCPVRHLSGGYCPGCGLTRATGAFVRGEWAEAVALHPYLPVLLAQLFVFGALRLIGPASIRSRIWNSLVPLSLANGVALMAIWILRLANGDIPVPFAG